MFQPDMPIAVTAVKPGQGGGGRKHKKTTIHDAQAGGFAIAPILAAGAAIHAGLSKFQPFSKVKKALEENVGDKGKQTAIYKVGHKIASIGNSVGYGAKKKKKKKSHKHK
jgi:hypothetical protein